MKASEIYVAVLVSVLILFVALFVFRSSQKTKNLTSSASNVLQSPKKLHSIKSDDVPITNHLIQPISVYLIEPGSAPTTTTAPRHLMTIDPSSVAFLDRKVADMTFIRGNMIRVYTRDESGSERLFSTYSFKNIPEGESINKLHIGMITSRWVGANSDFNIGKPGLNAVQGLPYIKIHNRTDYTITLNGAIRISPGGTLLFTGRDHFGVRLGTVFDDDNQIFPQFIFTVPATDVYYGIVSDIEQPLFGGFQIDEKFDEEPYEPQYLLEMGWMGGPAHGKIPYGYLPKEGPPLPPENRWGLDDVKGPQQVEKNRF